MGTKAEDGKCWVEEEARHLDEVIEAMFQKAWEQVGGQRIAREKRKGEVATKPRRDVGKANEGDETTFALKKLWKARARLLRLIQITRKKEDGRGEGGDDGGRAREVKVEEREEEQRLRRKLKRRGIQPETGEENREALRRLEEDIK